jgi:hypothetical protein
MSKHSERDNLALEREALTGVCREVYLSPARRRQGARVRLRRELMAATPGLTVEAADEIVDAAAKAGREAAEACRGAERVA